MQYTRYEEDIVQRYRIELQGWTYGRIMNPSLLSSSLPPLVALRDVLVEGTCKFVKLTAAERKESEVAYMAKIKSGEAEVRKRKRRSDTGTRKNSSDLVMVQMTVMTVPTTKATLKARRSSTVILGSYAFRIKILYVNIFLK
jgi:hypothetical protein